MKIRLKRSFTYQLSASQTVTLEPGVHDVDDEIGRKAMTWGKATLVRSKKKAPENKAGRAAENKAGVGKKAVRSRGTRSEPNASSR